MFPPPYNSPEPYEPKITSYEFTWIVPEVVAASCFPTPLLIEHWKNSGIKAVVNCSGMQYGIPLGPEFQYLYLPIEDFAIPTETQIQTFLEHTEKWKQARLPFVVHCMAGCGRTGTLLVAFAAYHHMIPVGDDPVAWIKQRRRCCLETGQQKGFALEITKRFQAQKR